MLLCVKNFVEQCFAIKLNLFIFVYWSHTIQKPQKMAGQNTFQILFLNDANMIGEH